MNIEQDQLDARHENLIRAHGLGEFRRQALKGLKLKTVIKESHCSQIQHLAFNMTDAELRAVFATVGKDQATIYDDSHMADHIGVIASFSVSDSIDAAKDTFSTCCWINSSGLSRHPYGDALLAIAGSDPFISIISVAEAAVVDQLQLPPGNTVAELSAAASQPGILLSLCKDGTMQLWHVATGMCCCRIKTDAFTAVLHPTGQYVVASNRSGKLSKWDMQSVLAAAEAVADPDSGNNCPMESVAALAAAGAAVCKEPLHVDLSTLAGSAVDCMRFLTGDKLAVKTADGCMAVFCMENGEALSTWKVPGCSNATANYSSRCCFGHTQDGQYICVGNHNATVYIFDTSTGMRVGRVEAIRVQGSVRACGLSEDCRHLLMVVGSGYVFRFEYRPPAESEGDADDERSDCDVEEAQQRRSRSRSVSLQPDPLCTAALAGQHLQQQPGLQQAAAAVPAGPGSSSICPQQQQQHISAADPTTFQQQQQQQHLPGFPGMPTGHSPLNLGELTGTIGTHTAQWMSDETGMLGPHGDVAEGLLQPPLSADMTAAKPKRQRLGEMADQGEGAGPMDVSPLTFRATPSK